MAEQHWYQRCTMSMSLTRAASAILADRAQQVDAGAPPSAAPDPDTAAQIVNDALADYNLIGATINTSTDRLELHSLREDESWIEQATERPSQYGIEDLLQIWAPLCADGHFMELATENLDIETGYFRLIVSGGRVIHDFPHLIWDDPGEIATRARAQHDSRA